MPLSTTAGYSGASRGTTSWNVVLIALPGPCRLLLKDNDILWPFLKDGHIALTNNEIERALHGYVLRRKDSYRVWSHRGEKFRQCILLLVETAKRLGRNTQERLRFLIRINEHFQIMNANASSALLRT